MGESLQAAGIAELRAALDDLKRDASQNLTWTDDYASELLCQVIALEECLAARWPRSILVRARWRRDVRASVRFIGGDTFTARRINTIGTGWLAR